jgi:hypothetical protein
MPKPSKMSTKPMYRVVTDRDAARDMMMNEKRLPFSRNLTVDSRNISTKNTNKMSVPILSEILKSVYDKNTIIAPIYAHTDLLEKYFKNNTPARKIVAPKTTALMIPPAMKG